MITYYDELSQEEQQEVRDAIQLLQKQTFILERKYDRRVKRLQFNREFRICNKHLDFIREYFAIAGVEVQENSQTGIIYLRGESLVGDKIPKLTTLYVLILKLIYDEQMSAAFQDGGAQGHCFSEKVSDY